MGKCFACSIVIIALVATGCQGRQYLKNDENGKEKFYILRLNPPEGAKFRYSVKNEYDIAFDLTDREIENASRSEVDVQYGIDTDSAGNFVVKMRYEKIKLYTKNGDQENNYDSEAANSLENGDRLLQAMKNQTLTATVTPDGQVREVKGQKEMFDKMLQRLQVDPVTNTENREGQWKELVEKRIVKKNLNQVFNVLPVKGVKVGDKWQLRSKFDEDLSAFVDNTFTFENIDGDIAEITIDGNIVSTDEKTTVMGTEVTAALEGKQKGRLKFHLGSGMLAEGFLRTTITGSLRTLGREIPLKLQSKISLDGQPIN